MAGTEPVLLAVEGARQAAQLGALSGKSYVVGQVSSAGNGLMGNWLFLQPAGELGAAAAKKTVAIKLEGARQLASLSGLTGKTVTVAKAPMTVGGACNWLALNPVTGGAAAGGVAQGSTAGLVMVKLEGGRQAAQLSGMAGKSFSVVPSPLMGGKGGSWLFLQPAQGSGKLIALKVQANAGSVTSSSLVGKTFVLGKAPVVAAKGGETWLMLQPAGGGVLAKGGAVAAALGTGGPMATAQTVALAPPQAVGAVKGGAAGLAGAATSTPAAAVGKTGAAAVAGKTAVTKAAGSGVIWKGTGVGLGLGLGLGPWGPALLLGAAVTGVGVYSYLKRRNMGEGDEVEEATA
ncbi:MAG: putative MamD protein [Magnetococcales bacterium]|nr:putative MamD protein [Magnetococcales bacterium]HIJ83718.1 hypothetical protein [Magnetococcales bacterium]